MWTRLGCQYVFDTVPQSLHTNRWNLPYETLEKPIFGIDEPVEEVLCFENSAPRGPPSARYKTLLYLWLTIAIRSATFIPKLNYETTRLVSTSNKTVWSSYTAQEHQSWTGELRHYSERIVSSNRNVILSMCQVKKTNFIYSDKARTVNSVRSRLGNFF